MKNKKTANLSVSAPETDPFARVIGYSSIKKELLQIVDILKNPDVYTALGARIPKGLLLDGNPGLGKTLMANCLIEASGLPVYTIRRTSGSNDFLEEIKKAFSDAKENAPAIVFLDDMDKYSNEDGYHRDTEEYVAVQAGIDDVKEYDVFVLATTNEIEKLPPSLVRSGRFDRRIDVRYPSSADCDQIMKYYLSNKKLDPEIDQEDMIRMIQYSSCADLETMINEAAIYAGSARKEYIEMEDLIHVILNGQYGYDYDDDEDDDDFDESYEAGVKDNSKSGVNYPFSPVAMHEAGHLVICELIKSGSVGIASVRKNRNHQGCRGFIRRCKKFDHPEDDILISLAGKAASELYFPGVDIGSQSDIERACRGIFSEMDHHVYGIDAADIFGPQKRPDTLFDKRHMVINAEENRYLGEVRGMLLQNREFLETVATALTERGVLLYSDIREIREKCCINGLAG